MPTLPLRDNYVYSLLECVVFQTIVLSLHLYYFLLIYLNLTPFSFTLYLQLIIASVLFLLSLWLSFPWIFSVLIWKKLFSPPMLWGDIKEVKWTVKKQNDVLVFTCNEWMAHVLGKIFIGNYWDTALTFLNKKSIWREQTPITPHKTLLKVSRVGGINYLSLTNRYVFIVV